MMTAAQEQFRFENACRALAELLVPPKRKQVLRDCQDYQHLISRFSTLHSLLGDAIEALKRSPSPSHAIALILAADFVWKVVRVLAGREGSDSNWLFSVLPVDHEASDADIGDRHYARQKQIVEDALWIFQLHSALRHPGKLNQEFLAFLREPVGTDARTRLLDAACAVSRVLLNVQVDLDPTVSLSA